MESTFSYLYISTDPALSLSLLVWQAEHDERVLVKEMVQHRERKGRALGLGFRKVLFLLFFNIMLMWKIVRVSKVSVLYLYIDI